MENDNSQLHYMQISVDHMGMMEYLTDEQRGITFRQVFAYFRGEKTKEEIIAEISSENIIILPIFDLLQKSIDRGRNAYEERCRKNRENGKRGGAPKGNQNARKHKKEVEYEEETAESEEWDEEWDEELVEKLMDRSNSTLAYWYHCLADELKENDMNFSMFFDWNQLCTFMRYMAFICIEYDPAVKGDLSFASYMNGGIDFFVKKITELGADGFLEDMRNTYKEDFVTHYVENKSYSTEEEASNFFDIVIDQPVAEHILCDVAKKDPDLQKMMSAQNNQNNRTVEKTTKTSQ